MLARAAVFDGRKSHSLVRGIAVLACPVFIEESLSLAVGYTDWWLAGHYFPGAATFAAMSLMAYLLWLLPSMFASLAIGVTAVVARRFGEGRPEDANRAVHQAMFGGAAVALVGMVVAQGIANDLPHWLQLSPAASRLVTRYFRIVAAVIPLIMIEQILIASLRGAGYTLAGLWTKLLVVVANLIVSTGCVTGWGPFPKLGWEGLALGTATAHALGGLVLTVMVWRGTAGLSFQHARWRIDGPMQRLLWRIGAPGGLDMLLILGFQFTFISIVYRLGDLAAASHGLAVQIEALGYLPGSAFQVAAATMAGQYLGANNRAAARRAALACWLGGSLVMMSAGLVFAYRGEPVASWFVGPDDSPVIALAAQLLVIIGAGMPALALVLIGSGTLRGAGDTRWPLITTLSGFALIRLPLAILFAWPPSDAIPWTWGMGVEGAWWAMILDLWVRALMIGGRLLQGGWERIDLRH